MGYQRQPGPIPTSLKTIDPNGGLIGKVSVVVSRIYPTLFREKTADGQSSKSVFISLFSEFQGGCWTEKPLNFLAVEKSANDSKFTF